MFGDEPAFPSKSSQIEDHSLQLNLYRNSGKNLESNHPCLPSSTLRLMDKQNESTKSWNNTYASSVTSNRIIGQNSFPSWNLPITLSLIVPQENPPSSYGMVTTPDSL